jgi:S1-C subfamily serine protease
MLLVPALACLMATVCPVAGIAEEVLPYEAFAKQHIGAYVIVKFVLKMQSDSDSYEHEAEISGLMISDTGLVLCASSQLGAPRYMRRYGTATPTDLKILIGEDTEGVAAKVTARDTELDLAWVQIKDAGKKKFEFLDLAKSVVPATGSKLMFMRKMAKYFDRATIVTEGKLVGRTHKPRELLVPGGGMNLDSGLPVYDAKGEVVGIVVLQLPDDEELQSNPMAFAGIGRDVSNGLILPAPEVVKATARALKAAEAEDEDPDAAPATTTKKASDNKKSATSMKAKESSSDDE